MTKTNFIEPANRVIRSAILFSRRLRARPGGGPERGCRAPVPWFSLRLPLRGLGCVGSQLDRLGSAELARVMPAKISATPATDGPHPLVMPGAGRALTALLGMLTPIQFEVQKKHRGLKMPQATPRGPGHARAATDPERDTP